MRSKLLALFIGLALLAAAACGDGGSTDDGVADGNNGGPSASAPADGPVKTPKVKAAAASGVNRPKEGVYEYEFASQSTNASTPDATPKRSSPDAELRSTVSYEGDDTVTADKTSEVDATSTVVHRFTDDAVLEISFKLETEQGSGGCTYSEPIEILPIPIEKTTIPKQTYEGRGASCGGERTIAIERQTTVKDAAGTTWKVWLIRVDTQGTSAGLTKKTVDMRWFSPDLGKDIRYEQSNDYINEAGAVAAHSEASSLLKAYPA
jgi:hypothetical protein